MKLFYHPPADKQIRDLLHEREMRIERLLNLIRAIFLSVIILSDIVFMFHIHEPFRKIMMEVLVWIGLLILFFSAHFITSRHRYYFWFKYITVTADLAGTLIYSQFAIRIDMFHIDPLTFLVIISIVFLFFNTLSVLRGGAKVIMYSGLITLLANFSNFALSGFANAPMLAYVSIFICCFTFFNLFAGNAIIENIVNNHLLNSAMEDLRNASAEIESQNDMLVSQRDKILLQKKEITDSIHYALRIQTAILPPDYHVKKCLQDCFILYIPKDVVSGDFYYVDKVGDSVIFSAVDCTGHGVPGAMMSVIGYNLLNQAVKLKKMTVPSEILKFLDEGVTETLRQLSGESGVNDGMDLALCSFDLKTNILQYSGAFNPLVYIRNGQLHEVGADKFPIGSNFDGIADTYANHSIQMTKGDTVYLYSDGYADQFGGPRNKKFKYKQLHELLLANHALSMEIQQEQLRQRFLEWKGDFEQTDDVIVMGMRV